MKRVGTLLVACGAIAAQVNVAAAALQAQRVGTGFSSPVFAAAPPGTTNTLWVVQQGGQIRELNTSTGVINPTTVFTANDISTGGERGLLGLAFAPDYATATNKYFYINKTNAAGNTEVIRYTVSGGVATSPLPIINYTQPFANHNGGWMGFGPDGMLYIASGDGGDANDPGNRAQDKTSLLGKMLRIDPSGDDFTSDATRNYKIPDGNPGKDVSGYSDEIWAYGLRNPWRNSFDRANGDLWIGDVGQDAREEIDRQAAAAGGGQNYGWRVREGLIKTPGIADADIPAGSRVDPIYDYAHVPANGSITGGYVYRGPAISDGTRSMEGLYFFADYRSGQIWTLELLAGGGVDIDEYTSSFATPIGGGTIGTFDIVSFGEDNLGRLYIVDYDGDIYVVIPEPTSVAAIGLGGLLLLRRRRAAPEA